MTTDFNKFMWKNKFFNFYFFLNWLVSDCKCAVVALIISKLAGLFGTYDKKQYPGSLVMFD